MCANVESQRKEVADLNSRLRDFQTRAQLMARLDKVCCVIYGSL